MKFLMTVRGGAISLAIAICFAGCNRQSPTLDQLIERNAEAVGGKSAIEAIHSIRVELHIADPGFEVDGSYLAARPGWMRIDITAGGQHVYTEALSRTRGWQWKGKGEPGEESAMATAALHHGVELPGHLFGLHELRPRGDRIDLIGREKVDGINYHVLRLTLSDSYITTLYLDPESWLITRKRDVRPLHPDVDPTATTIENKMSDFRRVGDVLFPFASTDADLSTGKILETTAVRSITLNPAFDPRIFETL